MDVLCTYEIKIESQIWIMGISNTKNHTQIKMKMPNPSQEPAALSKAPNQYLEDMDVLCTFQIQIEIQNLEYGCIKVQ